MRFAPLALGFVLSLAPAIGVRSEEAPPAGDTIPELVLQASSVVLHLPDGSVVFGNPEPGPISATGEPGQPQRIRVTWPPEASAQLPGGILTLVEGRPTQRVTGVVLPEGALEKEEDLAPETLAWNEHRETLRDLGIQRGADVGGRARIGVRLAGREGVPQLEPEVAGKLDSWDGAGALVVRVVPGSPAESAGLQPGDVIVQFAGLWVDNHAMMIRMATRAQVGREYELQFLRDGEVQSAWLLPVDEATLQP